MKIPDLFSALLLLLLISPLFCQGNTTPIIGTGLEITFHGLGFDEQGIVETAVGGAINTDGGINLNVMRGSQLTYDRTGVKGGSISFRGGIQFAKGASKVVLSQFALDLKTGMITVKMGAKANVLLGTTDVTTAELNKQQGTNKLTISLSALKLGDALPSIINGQLGTTLQGQDETMVDSSVSFDVDLILGSKINDELVAALGLGPDIEVDQGVDGLVNSQFDVTNQFISP